MSDFDGMEDEDAEFQAYDAVMRLPQLAIFRRIKAISAEHIEMRHKPAGGRTWATTLEEEAQELRLHVGWREHGASAHVARLNRLIEKLHGPRSDMMGWYLEMEGKDKELGVLKISMVVVAQTDQEAAMAAMFHMADEKGIRVSRDDFTVIEPFFKRTDPDSSVRVMSIEPK